MAKVYLSLGSNMGDKKDHLDQAVEMLKAHKAIDVMAVSSYYETAPVGYVDQDVFMNIAVGLETNLEPYAMLAVCQEIEQALKRKRIIRWGPRSIDVDILLYDDWVSDDEVLTVPHPRMTERGFVIVPLYEIASDLVIEGQSIEAIYNGLDKDDIRKIKDER